MFRIKICGITTPADALLAADLGADAIGLNFYEKSPRYVSPAHATAISNVLPPEGSSPDRPRVFGVFVNSLPDDEVFEDLCRAITDFQFHGDEPASMIATWSKTSRVLASELPKELSVEWLMDELRRHLKPNAPQTRSAPLVVRAFRPKSESLSFVADYLHQCQSESEGALPHAVLLDAHAPNAYGGTGQTLDWASIPNERDKLLGLPLILAGGLTPDNVAEAIATARPDAVDVASGVESSPGKKDPTKVQDFIAAAKSAFAALDKSSP